MAVGTGRGPEVPAEAVGRLEGRRDLAEAVADDRVGAEAPGPPERGQGDLKGAKDRLRDLGLEPTPVEVENPGDQPEGVVTAVEPSGTLQEGDTVTVSYWAKVPPGQAKDDEGNDEG